MVHRFGPAAVVSLSGPDARRFANGMFTNHVLPLENWAVQRHAACDARGRMLGLFDLVSLDRDELLLVLEGWDPEDFLAHYERYLLMDDAELANRSGGRTHLTLQGPGAETLLESLGLPLPERVAVHGDILVYRRDRAGMAGFDVVTPDPSAFPADDPAFESRRIAAGEVRWPADMSEKQLVHELGLRDQVLCFTKGCYIGQETINRLEVRGGVKQRLVGLRLGAQVPSGSAAMVGGKTVGTLRSVARHADHGWIGLAVVRMPHDAPGTTLEVAGTQGTTVDLPLA